MSYTIESYAVWPITIPDSAFPGVAGTLQQAYDASGSPASIAISAGKRFEVDNGAGGGVVQLVVNPNGTTSLRSNFGFPLSLEATQGGDLILNSTAGEVKLTSPNGTLSLNGTVSSIIKTEGVFIPLHLNPTGQLLANPALGIDLVANGGFVASGNSSLQLTGPGFGGFFVNGGGLVAVVGGGAGVLVDAGDGLDTTVDNSAGGDTHVDNTGGGNTRIDTSGGGSTIIDNSGGNDAIFRTSGGGQVIISTGFVVPPVSAGRMDISASGVLVLEATSGQLFLRTTAANQALNISTLSAGNIQIQTLANTGEQILIGTLGSLLHLGSSGGTIGFFGSAGTTKPTGVAVSAAGIHAALVSLNLIAP